MICDRCNGTGMVTHPAIKGTAYCPKFGGTGVITSELPKGLPVIVVRKAA